jgi:hypothetical protein
MKKIIILALALISALPVFGFDLNTLATAKGTTSGSATTATIAAVSGKRIVIWNFWMSSDRANTVLKVQDADATGTTTNYTTKALYNVGAASVNILGYGNPVYTGPVYTGIKLLLNNTTTGSVVVNYTYE